MPAVTAIADPYSISHDHVLTATVAGSEGVFGVLNNDSSNAYGGGGLNVTEINGDSFEAGVPFELPSGASLTIYADGSFAYTPLSGSVYEDDFEYTATDADNSQTALVSIDITNAAPFIESVTLTPTAPTTNETLTANVIGSDAEGDSITYVYAWYVNDVLLPTATSSTLVLSQTGFGNRGDEIYVTVTPSDALTSGVAASSAALTVANSAPGLSGYSINMTAPGTNDTLIITPLATDADGDDVTFQYAWYVNNILLPTATSNALDLSEAGFGDVSDTISVTVTPTDETDTGGYAEIFWTVANSAPTFTGGDDETVDEDHGARSVAGWATDIAGEPGGSTSQGLSFEIQSNTNADLFVEGPSISSDGTLSYTPDANANGSAEIVVVLRDDGGGADVSATYTFTITVNAINDAPVAFDGTSSTGANSTVDGLLDATDPDAGDALTYAIVDLLGYIYGSVEISDSATGAYTFDPGYDFDYLGIGETTDVTFTFKVTDSYSAVSLTKTITITVTGVNDAPIVWDTDYSIAHDQSQTIDLSNCLFDFDSDFLEISIVSDPSHGSLTENEDGTRSYTPSVGWTGTDSFTFKAHDGTTDSEIATVYIAVTNAAPTATDAYYSTPADDTLIIDAANGVLVDSADIDGDSLSAQVVSTTNHGTLTFSSVGSFTYVRNEGFVGLDTFTYKLSDGLGFSQTKTVTISVFNAEEAQGGGALSGPSVVPGNSRYTYWIGPQDGATNPQAWLTTPAGDPVDSCTAFITWVGSWRSTGDRGVEVEFYNLATQVQVHFSLTIGGETVSWEKVVSVVEITVDTPTNAFVRSTNLGYTDNGGNFNLASKGGEAFGFDWSAGITLTAPDAAPNAVSSITVGFVQHVTITRVAYSYTNGDLNAQYYPTYLGNSIEGRTFLDSDAATNPWYASGAAAPAAANAIFNDASAANRSKTIFSNDSPNSDIPYRQGTFGFRWPCYAVQYILNFKLEVGASIGGATPIWRQAEVGWSVNLSGNFDQNAWGWNWSWRPTAGVTGPAGDWIVATSAQGIDVAGPVANSVTTPVTWGWRYA